MNRILPLLILSGLLQTGFAEPPGIRDYAVPLRDGNLHSRELTQTILKAGGSEVELPADFPNQKIPIHRGTAKLNLFIWNTLLKDFGVALSLRDHEIALRVDLKKLEGNLDEFEERFTRFLGIERNASLNRLSPEGTDGPAVVFLHGLDSSRRFFKGACEVLVEKGYDLYFFEYPNDDQVVENAKRLSDALKILPPERRRDISLLTHSMGGVIGQYMIETPELHVPGVKRLIACAPPFQGSELAALRGFVELGDQTMGLLTEPAKGPSFFGDGMGRAGRDLRPGSLLMERLDRLERNPEVEYSILAGDKGIVDPAVLRRMQDELRAEEADNPLAEAARRLALERVEVMLKFASGKGDGAVNLDSATLEGVDDRVVLPLHHLEFLTGLDPDREIGAMDEVLKRLPEARPSE